MNNLDRWIDPRVKLVRAAGLQAYLRARGWKEVPSPRHQVLMFEEPVAAGEPPVVQAVPAKEGGGDYVDAVIRVISNLAALEDRHAVEVLNEVLQQAVPDLAVANGPTPQTGLRRKQTRS